MTIHMLKKGLYASLFCSLLVSVSFAARHPKIMPPATVAAPSGKLYIGMFGGGGAPNKLDVYQSGTAFFPEASGGPLAVDAFGRTNNPTAWFVGAQIGYQAQERSLNFNSSWTVAPAVELEGYYIGKQSFTGNLINNTDRLPERDFKVNYPMERSVFLTNAILNFNDHRFLLHPYVGVGIGGALSSISNADATQVNPPEAGINHFNSKTKDSEPTFAGQVKAGVSYDINQYVSLFAEYRWLYLASAQFTFGSTVHPAHVPTSAWQAKFDPQHYNMGTVGIRFNV